MCDCNGSVIDPRDRPAGPLRGGHGRLIGRFLGPVFDAVWVPVVGPRRSPVFGSDRGLVSCMVIGLALLLAPPPSLAAAADESPTETAESTEDDAKPSDREEAVLSFTDDDLKKYQRKSPETDTENSDAPDAGADSKPERRKAAKSRPAEQMGVPVAAKPKAKASEVATAPADDPMKPFRDREAKEAYRAEQLEILRGRIAGIESRLAYLQQRRLAVLDPLRIMPAAQNDADRQAEAASGSRDLLEAVDKEIETLEKSLESTKENLVAIETRFGHQAAGR